MLDLSRRAHSSTLRAISTGAVWKRERLTASPKSRRLGALLRSVAYHRLPTQFYQMLQMAIPFAAQLWFWGWNGRRAGWSSSACSDSGLSASSASTISAERSPCDAVGPRFAASAHRRRRPRCSRAAWRSKASFRLIRLVFKLPRLRRLTTARRLDVFSIRRSGTSQISATARRSRRQSTWCTNASGIATRRAAPRCFPLQSLPTAAASVESGPWCAMIVGCRIVYAIAAASSTHAVDRGRQRREVILAHPRRHERNERQPEQQMQVGPQNAAVDPSVSVEHVVMVVPVDAEKDEAQHVAEEHGQQRAERRPVGAVRHAAAPAP